MKLNEEIKEIQPFYLPQMDVPFQFIIDNLKEMNIQWKPVIVRAGQLKAIQKSVDLNKVEKIAGEITDKMPPIFISNKDHILDGHHRTAGYIFRFGKDAKIKAIRIDADDKNGTAILKIIEDRFAQQQKNKEK